MIYLLAYKIRQINMVIRSAQYRSNQDPWIQRHIPLVLEKLDKERTFLQHKVDNNFYRSHDLFPQNKSEIVQEFNKDVIVHLSNGLNKDQILQQPDTIMWLNLVQQTVIDRFRNTINVLIEIRTYHAQLEPVPYGPPRDFEMVHDYLLNYMEWGDANIICATFIAHALPYIN